MARDTSSTPPESVISIIGPGMTVVGDCKTEGTVRVEGVVEGSIRAAKAVVIGKQGKVVGDIHTQDAVISGHVSGTLVAESRLELQATCRIDGQVHTRRMQLEEGAVLNGTVEMGDKQKVAAGSAGSATSGQGSDSQRNASEPAKASVGR